MAIPENFLFSGEVLTLTWQQPPAPTPTPAARKETKMEDTSKQNQEAPKPESKFHQLRTTIENGIEGLITLQIRTVVGSFTLAPDPTADKLVPTGTAHYLETTTDLVGGDITTKIDDWFLVPERKPVLDMHLQREKQGSDIIKGNIEALKELWKLVSEMIHDKGEGTSPK
jgi:hypothetical protein